MRRIVLLLSITCMVFDTMAQPMRDLYGFKSGHIEYELTGNTTGTKTIWWDNYGAQSFTETNSVTRIEMFGIANETKIHSISVIDNDSYWTADLITKTGEKGSLSALIGDMAFEYENFGEDELEEAADKLLEDFDGERLGTEMFLGCDCEVISVWGNKSWICKGVILKSEVETMGVKANETAIRFETNIGVPASVFELRQGIDYYDTDEHIRNMEQYRKEQGY